MNKIIDILHSKNQTFSIELFPPKTEKGYANLIKTISQLASLKPDYFSCTYGAGGGSRDKTLEIVEHIEKTHQITAMAHLTCVLHTKDEIKQITGEIKRRGIQNILALRGDPPRDHPDWQPGADNFHYSSELTQFLRNEYQNYFGIGVAGFPEGHILCPDRDRDAEFLKKKIDAGADFVITQLFFDNQDYFDYVQRLRNLGITAPVIPGILPITNYNALLRFTEMCGATVTQEVHNIFRPVKDDPDATRVAGEKFCIKKCRELLDQGAPGIHFYALNKLEPVRTILEHIR